MKKNSKTTSGNKQKALVITVAEAERIFEMSIPAPYSNFIKNGDCITYSGSKLVYRSPYVFEINTKLDFDNAKDIERIFAGEPFGGNNMFLYEEKTLVYLPISKISIGRRSLEFLSIDIREPKECPVVYINIGNGEVLKKKISVSLSDFLKLLVVKNAVDPTKELELKIKEMSGQFEKTNYQKTVAIAGEILEAYEKLDPARKKMLEKLPGMALNYRGLCKQNLGRLLEGLADQEEAFKAGNIMAGLNLTRLFIVRKKPEEAREILSKMSWVDDPFYVSYYNALCYIMLGNEKDATENFRYLHNEFRKSKPKLIKEVREELEDVGDPISEKILTWFGCEKSIANLTAEQIKDNRAWWNSLPPALSKAMAKHTHHNVKTITDAHVYEIIEDLDYIVAKCPNVKDFTPLLRMKSLRILSLRISLKISLKQFALFTNLDALDLDYNKITDITPLAKLIRLKKLELNNNNITDIAPLSALNSLENLRLRNNPLRNIEALKTVLNLKELHLSVTQVSDLAPLSGLKALEELSVAFTKIADLSPLTGCPNLKSIDCSGCKELSKDTVAKFKKLRPDVEIEI
jgi:tetratricopeptide (TPR) repeat protein